MNALQIRVTWPDGTYHGREWPPSPLRLYQAMLAGYRTARAQDPHLDAALLHLETLEPPTIHAPPAVEQSPVAASVPNNDGDVTLGHWARGAQAQARVSQTKLRTIRVRRTWRLDGPVTYTWRTNAHTRDHLPAIVQLAASLSVLGQGMDLAWARAAADGFENRGLHYRPDAAGALRLTVPYPGVLDVLEQRHQALRSRIQGNAVRGVPEPDHAEIGYRSDLDPPGRAWTLLSLRDVVSDGPWSAEWLAAYRHRRHDSACYSGRCPARGARP